MDFLASGWLPIVLSAVFVFFASFLAWAVLPYHHKEWKRVSDERGLQGAFIELGLGPGQYSVPHGGSERLKEPEYKEMIERGPIVFMNVLSGSPNMGKNMALSLVLNLVIATFVAYLLSFTVLPGDSYLHVFRIAGVAGVLAYTSGGLLNDIWFAKPGRAILTATLDGIVFGLIVAGTFGWLWPR